MKGYKTSRNGLIIGWVSITIIFFGLLLILVTTYSPYDFHFKDTDSSSGYNFLILGWGKSGILDVQGNILLFIPLGFGLAGCLMQTVRLTRLTSLALTILVSFGLSYIIEVLQVFLPSRFPSLIDVFSNSMGGLLGFLCFRLWACKVKVIDYTSNFVKNNLLLNFLGYATLAFLISVSLQWYSNLSNWDRTFHLLLGNEWTGDRPWQGYISDVYIADRAISETEVASTFSKKDSITSIGDSLVASYELTGLGNYNDKKGHLPDLVWRGKPQDVQQGEGVYLAPNHWLGTTIPAAYLTQRIAETSQFTLGISVATSDTTQTGPARIVSLSEDTGNRNFTLGQQGSDLVFRLRTLLTGENGVNPELIVPDVFSTTNPHNLVITYDGSVLLLYVDGVLNSHALRLDPWGISCSYLFELSAYNLACYKILYYAIIFIPLGILLSLTVNSIKGRIVIKILIITGCILFSSFIIEVILVNVRGGDLRLENLLISIIFTTSPIVFKLLTWKITDNEQKLN